MRTEVEGRFGLDVFFGAAPAIVEVVVEEGALVALQEVARHGRLAFRGRQRAPRILSIQAVQSRAVHALAHAVIGVVDPGSRSAEDGPLRHPKNTPINFSVRCF